MTQAEDAWVQISAGVAVGGWRLSYGLNLNLVKIYLSLEIARHHLEPSLPHRHHDVQYEAAETFFTDRVTCSAHKRSLAEQSSMYQYHHLQRCLRHLQTDVAFTSKMPSDCSISNSRMVSRDVTAAPTHVYDMKEGLEDQRGKTTALAADVCLRDDRTPAGSPASRGTTYAL